MVHDEADVTSFTTKDSTSDQPPAWGNWDDHDHDSPVSEPDASRTLAFARETRWALEDVPTVQTGGESTRRGSLFASFSDRRASNVPLHRPSLSVATKRPSATPPILCLSPGGARRLTKIEAAVEKAEVSPPFNMGPLDCLLTWPATRDDLAWLLRTSAEVHIVAVLCAYYVLAMPVLGWNAVNVATAACSLAISIASVVSACLGRQAHLLPVNMLLLHAAPVIAFLRAAGTLPTTGVAALLVARESTLSLAAVYLSRSVEKTRPAVWVGSVLLSLAIAGGLMLVERRWEGGPLADDLAEAEIRGDSVLAWMCHAAVLLVIFRHADVSQRIEMQFLLKQPSFVSRPDDTTTVATLETDAISRPSLTLGSRLSFMRQGSQTSGHRGSGSLRIVDLNHQMRQSLDGLRALPKQSEDRRRNKGATSTSLWQRASRKGTEPPEAEDLSVLSENGSPVPSTDTTGSLPSFSCAYTTTAASQDGSMVNNLSSLSIPGSMTVCPTVEASSGASAARLHESSNSDTVSKFDVQQTHSNPVRLPAPSVSISRRRQSRGATVPVVKAGVQDNANECTELIDMGEVEEEAVVTELPHKIRRVSIKDVPEVMSDVDSSGNSSLSSSVRSDHGSVSAIAHAKMRAGQLRSEMSFTASRSDMMTSKVEAINLARELRNIASSRWSRDSGCSGPTLKVPTIPVQPARMVVRQAQTGENMGKRLQKEASELFTSWDDICSDEVSYQQQLMQVWDLLDAVSATTGTGYLCEAEVQTALEMCGVEMSPEDRDDFSSFCIEDGFANFVMFCATFEDFRSEGVFTCVYSRPRISAMCLSAEEKSSQMKAQHECDLLAPNAPLTKDMVRQVLEAMSLPSEPADLRALMEEIGSDDAIEPHDLVALFNANHFDHQADQDDASFIQVVRKAVERGTCFKSSDQQLHDRARVAHETLERKLPLVWLYTLATLCLASFELCFGVRQIPVVALVYIMSDAILVAWVIKRVLLPKEDSGQLVINKRRILRGYFSSVPFVVDVIALFPLDLLGMAIEGRFDRDPFYRVNKLVLLYYFNRLLSASLAWLGPIVARISKALLYFLLQAHALSCVFKIVANSVGDRNTSVILNNYDSFSQRGLGSQYLQAFDYSMKTMSGLSRGTPMPATDLQHVNAILAVLTGVAAYAYFLATVSNALQTPSQESKLKEKLDAVNAFLVYSKIPEEFRHQCLNYYKHVFSTSGSYSLAENLLDDLPDDLDVVVRVVTCRNVISKVPIFQDAADDVEFVHSISRKLLAEVVSPGEFVTQKGMPGSSMYFITHGDFALLDAEGNTVLTLTSGNFFGEIALLHNVRRTATIQAVRFGNVLRLDKGDFEQVAEQFPNALLSIRDAAHDRIAQLMMDEEKARVTKATTAKVENPLVAPHKDGIGKWLQERQMENRSSKAAPKDKLSNSLNQTHASNTSSNDERLSPRTFIGRRIRHVSVFEPETAVSPFGGADRTGAASEKVHLSASQNSSLGVSVNSS